MRIAAIVPMSALLAVAWQGRGSAEERRYSLVIGYNGAPASGSGAPLRFADDDALAFVELRRQLADETVLLTVPDSESRRRYPEAVERAQPPTIVALDRAMAQIGDALRADRSAGRTTVFSFFYSGHGVRAADGEATLTLLDEGLTRRMLFERVIDRAPADVIHLFIDACHAEAMVRSRDGDASANIVALSPDDIADSQRQLGKHPNVGFIVASSSEGAAHEWDAYQSGVFTHEVVSAMRGAADVNGDGRIEYSELGAFLSAANREVQDPRARLHTIVRPPMSAPRSPLADFSRARDVARLVRIPAAIESISIEDAFGNHLAEGRPELGFFMTISLPANQQLFIRRGDQEAGVVLRPGIDREFRGLAFQERPSRPRGALESSMRAGLFLAQFGPAYYRGYVDAQEVVPVPIAALPSLTVDTGTASPAPRRAFVPRAVLSGGALACVATSLAFSGLAWQAWRDNRNATEQASIDANHRYRTDVTLAGTFLVSGMLVAGVALLIGSD